MVYTASSCYANLMDISQQSTFTTKHTTHNTIAVIPSTRTCAATLFIQAFHYYQIFLHLWKAYCTSHTDYALGSSILLISAQAIPQEHGQYLQNKYAIPLSSTCELQYNCAKCILIKFSNHWLYGLEIWNERLEWVTETIQFVLSLTELLNRIIRRPTKSPHLPGSSFDLSTGWMSSVYNGITVTHCPRQWPTHHQDHTMHTQLP